MDFVRSHFGKMNLWPVEYYFPHLGVPVVLKVPQTEEISVQLVREVHLSEVTSYIIHISVEKAYFSLNHDIVMKTNDQQDVKENCKKSEETFESFTFLEMYSMWRNHLASFSLFYGAVISLVSLCVKQIWCKVGHQLFWFLPST